MSTFILKYYSAIIIVIVFAHCVKPYNPPALQAKNNYLVVDGFINAGANQITTIILSRTRSISDSTAETDPELGASIQIVADDGSTYPLIETGNGNYQSAALNLNTSKTYQLKITTANGKNYISDLAACTNTPQIDSLTWQQPGDVHIYLYTHDPANSTHYYKWDYTETWEYKSPLQGYYVVKGDHIFVADTTDQIDSCWQSDLSSDILTGSSVALSDDVINHAKIATVPQNDEKIFVRYSILVRQRGISADAYKYWGIIQKNSQDRGGLFDVQPGQLVGNVHCESDPTEPVIGFINASSETEKRMFIEHKDLTNWNIGSDTCDQKTIPQDPNDFSHYYYTDPDYTAFFFSGPDIVIAQKICLDCTTHGGTNQRPSFWR
ncbi:MAG: DUF4249 domain-containing protein [Parafilimonas sp.]|nr:DUF4249 domain-containing protein [Parafilimonas sp.]